MCRNDSGMRLLGLILQHVNLLPYVVLVIFVLQICVKGGLT